MGRNMSFPQTNNCADLYVLKREACLRSTYEKLFEDIFSNKAIIDGNGDVLDMTQKKEIAKILAASMPLP
jgi:hypothetical protein